MPRKYKALNKSSDDAIVDVVSYLMSGLVLVLTLYPLLYVLSASFSDPVEVTSGRVLLLPKNITLEGYEKIFEYSLIWLGYRNSLFYTFVGTLINLACTLPCAYALSRKDLPGRNFFTLVLSFTMFFSGGLIPTYLIMKQLQLINTVFALLLPGTVSMMNVIIARTYFDNSIPGEMQEAAIVDGSSNTRLFLQIILPLSAPIVAVLALYYAVGHWNAYFNAMIYLSKQELYPLQIFLRNILVLNEVNEMLAGDPEYAEEALRRMQLRESMKFGLIVVSSLPVMLLYPFLQRFFVKGVMMGAIKG